MSGKPKRDILASTKRRVTQVRVILQRRVLRSETTARVVKNRWHSIRSRHARLEVSLSRAIWEALHGCQSVPLPSRRHRWHTAYQQPHLRCNIKGIMLEQSLWKTSRKHISSELPISWPPRCSSYFPELSYQPHRKRFTLVILEAWDIGRSPRCLPQFLQLPARIASPVIAHALATTHDNLDQMRTYRLFNDARATPVLSNTTKISGQCAALHNINIKGHYVLNCDSTLRLKPRR